jgi:hypothetical protein
VDHCLAVGTQSRVGNGIKRPAVNSKVFEEGDLVRDLGQARRAMLAWGAFEPFEHGATCAPATQRKYSPDRLIDAGLAHLFANGVQGGLIDGQVGFPCQVAQHAVAGEHPALVEQPDFSLLDQFVDRGGRTCQPTQCLRAQGQHFSIDLCKSAELAGPRLVLVKGGLTAVKRLERCDRGFLNAEGTTQRTKQCPWNIGEPIQGAAGRSDDRQLNGRSKAASGAESLANRVQIVLTQLERLLHIKLSERLWQLCGTDEALTERGHDAPMWLTIRWGPTIGDRIGWIDSSRRALIT